ncbi:hypothetical protein [Bacillus rubiinfantis]|uniref:hypothetical protein n=1 Tax=Bacillus rubiinfantis TaxID=1499680 RepID=UPI0005A8C70B|nr:hypothetical protein [Bacillus rubiinfantis]
MNPTNRKYWQFSPIPNIEESNFDKTLERFYNLRIPGLVRENIQNSLDGRLLDTTVPVVVTIKTGTIATENIPGIHEVITRIRCLKARNKYTEETIEHMLNKLSQKQVRYISFEDENTRGLSGAKNGQSHHTSDTWSIYAYNKGFHSEEDDETVETSRGGSHGVGKIASNAASDLHVMYFANCDAEGNQHLGGTVQLIEHQYEHQYYRSTGYFTDIQRLERNKTKFYPFENHFHDIFEKKTRGLKIIIPYLRDEYDDEHEMVKSVCDSFFMSILQKKLVVHINDKKITHETLLKFIQDPNYYVQTVAEMKKEFTPLYVNTYLKQMPQPIHVSDGVHDLKFQLYFHYNEEIPKGRVAIIRTIGMKIEDMKIKNNATKPFNAVFIGGTTEDAYLKSLENESHTQVSFDHIKDPQLKKRARRFINKLNEAITRIIEEVIRKNNQTDGAMDTKDILYVVENQFKKDLSDAMGTVVVNKGKSVVKVTPDAPKKKKKRGKKKPIEKPLDENKEPVKRKKRTPVPANKDNQEQPKVEYSVHPKIVERLVIGRNEMVKFNFTQSNILASEDVCNIKLSIIDGMGVEYEDDFSIHDNYDRVVDRATGEECPCQKNMIKNVKITNGVAQLRLELKQNYNKALKLIYHVEV